MSKIGKFFKRLLVPVPVKESKVEPERKPIKEKHQARLIRTSRGGLDMPRYQPCPECGKGSKRQVKTLSGAKYRCINHREFLVVRR